MLAKTLQNDDDFLLLSLDEKKHSDTSEHTQAKPLTLFAAAFKNTSAKIGMLILAALFLFALFYPLLCSYNYEETHLTQKNAAPSYEHLFGTDDLGRDLAVRVAHGMRISLVIGITAALLDMFIGLCFGAISGYFGGTLDHVMMRIADLIYSLPYLLAVIIIAAWVGPGIFSILVAMCLIGWIQMARLVRGQVLQAKQFDYVLSAYALGVHPFFIVFRHILPNISGVVIAMLMLTIPHAIFAEAFLSFLGIGIQPPLASLGSMVADALPAMRFYPWRLFAPACTITACILAFNLIGDALRDILDPKTKPFYVT